MYIEQQAWGETHYEVVPNSYRILKTLRQTAEFITNPCFGRMLFLNGVLQSASSDEHIYHEAMARLCEGRYILIAGGAEGGMAREVLKRDVDRVVMTDWDEDLVNHIRFKEGMNKEAFQDPRLRLEFSDILDYLRSTSESFDTVVLDLLDITTEEEFAFMKSILALVKGTVVMNVGSSRKMAELFGGEVVEVFVPSFQERWYIVKLSASV